MSPARAPGAARLTVALDVRHPLAALALRPTRALAEELGLAIDWLPLAVPPLRAPSQPGPGDDRGARHRRARAQAIAREIETYAAAQGIALADYYRDPDPAVAHQGWLFVRDRHPAALGAYLDELFRAYWAGSLDPSSPSQVAAIVRGCGGDAAAFEEWVAAEGPARLEEIERGLRQIGLHQVPAYWIDDEVFYGRQHLPMIRWLVSGRSGPGPL